MNKRIVTEMTAEKMTEIYTDEQLRNAVAYAHRCCDRNSNFLHHKALFYPIEYIVTEEQIAEAKTELQKAKNRVFADHSTTPETMTKTFTEKSAYELEQEMHRYFDGSIDRIAINYWRTKDEYLLALWYKRQDIVGIYVVKSLYHKSIYLPFAIVGYSETERKYHVQTVEYKGMTAYKVDTDYTEQTIHELIEKGVIVRKAKFTECDKPKIRTLLIRYSNAKQPLK